MRKISLTIAAGCVAVLAVPAAAQMASANFDTDADQRISEEEFRTGMNAAPDRSTFRSYDADSSGDISREEFAAADFRRYDTDSDDRLSADEYDAVTKVYGSADANAAASGSDASDATASDAADPEIKKILPFDADGDGVLNIDEYNRGTDPTQPNSFRDAGLDFYSYDADRSGSVSGEEFASGEFQRYDRDADQWLVSEEMDRFNEDAERLTEAE